MTPNDLACAAGFDQKHKFLRQGTGLPRIRFGWHRYQSDTSELKSAVDVWRGVLLTSATFVSGSVSAAMAGLRERATVYDAIFRSKCVLGYGVALRNRRLSDVRALPPDVLAVPRTEADDVSHAVDAGGCGA